MFPIIDAQMDIPWLTGVPLGWFLSIPCILVMWKQPCFLATGGHSKAPPLSGSQAMGISLLVLRQYNQQLSSRH